MTKQELYKKNQKRVKILSILIPVVFWGCLIFSIICFVSAIKNSFGNVAEVIDLLDSKKFTGEQLRDNYALLIEKYGEVVIGSGSSGFIIKFINLKNVVFNGFMMTNAIFFIVFLVCAFLLGKWLLPLLKHKIEVDNQDMVNLTILEDK